MGAARILVTGASGFIGRQIVQQLGGAGDEVFLLRRNPGYSPLDLGVPVASDGRTAAWPELKQFVLVHAAWCPPVRDNLAVHAAQVGWLANLLQAVGGEVVRIVGLGSAEEFGARGGVIRSDDPEVGFVSPYGWAKRSAAALLRCWAQFSAKPVFWLRPFLVYGEGQGGNMALPYAVRQACDGRVGEFSVATQRRDFVHVADVARAVRLAVEAEAAGFVAVNIGTGQGTELREVLERIRGWFTPPADFRYGVRPLRTSDPAEQVADPRVAEALMGFQAEIDLEQGLARWRKALNL